MKYFYARVSTRGQNLARQVEAAKEYQVDKVFSDKQSGKDFNRPGYQELKASLVAGDEIYIKSLDRLGRNKEEMKRELAWFKEHGVIVRVLDIPTTMIEFPSGQEWVLEMVNNILVEVLCALAQQEREMIQQRRAEGIAAMPVVNGRKVSAKTGRGFGRPECDVAEEAFQKCRKKQKDGLMTVRECCELLGISRSTWYDRVRKAG